MAVEAMETLTTQALLAEELAARAQVQKFDPHEIRISELGGCLRKATLRILDYPADSPTEQQLAIFAAGDAGEARVVRLWMDRFPRQCRRQVPVSWSLPDGTRGTGHIDLWVSPLRRIVESKTTKAASRPYLPLPEHVLQVTGYLHWWGIEHGAREAEIAYLIKETGEIVSFIIPYDPERARELVDRAMTIAAAVRAGEPLPIPADHVPSRFPCSWTTQDGQTAFCPFWRTCWGETAPEEEKPAREAAPEAPQLADAALALLRLEEAVARARDNLEAATQQRDKARAAMRAMLERMGLQAAQAGSVLVRFTEVPGRTTYDIAQALAAGAVTEGALAPFRKVGRPSERWTVKEVA